MLLKGLYLLLRIVFFSFTEVGLPPTTSFSPLRQLIDPTIKKEDRLIVVFVPLAGGAANRIYGAVQRLLHGSWWIHVPLGDTTSLMHEIGHACRLATSKSTASRAQTHKTAAKNMMSDMRNETNSGTGKWTPLQVVWCEGSSQRTGGLPGHCAKWLSTIHSFGSPDPAVARPDDLLPIAA